MPEAAKLQAPEPDERVFRARGGVAKLFRARAEEVLIEGGAGCVAGETLLWDPIAGVGRRIDELCAKGIRPWVLTLEGPRLAEVPFLKGFAPLYRVTLESGASCLATADHLFLGRQGWVFVADLEPGMELLAGSPAGAPRSSGRGAGSRAGCRQDRRSGGPRPPAWSGSAPASVPSAGGARARTRAGSPAGGPASTGASTRPCPGSDLPSTPSSGARRCSGTWDGDRETGATPASGDRAGGCRTTPSGRSSRGALRSRGSSPPPPQDERRDRGCACRPPPAPAGAPGRRLPVSELPSPGGGSPQAPPRRQGACAAVAPTLPGSLHAALPSGASSPSPHSTDEWSTIKSISYERTDWYYDLHVPGPEHYLADGIWSHNTGKSRGVCEYVNWLCETYPGIRVLLCRKTRKSLTESILVTLWEVHTLGLEHPAVRGGATPAHRDFYLYPQTTNVVDGKRYSGRSRVVLGGLDNVDRIMSAEYDVIVVFEATEATLEDWEKLTSRLRSNVLPWQQAIADCNPASEYHWLNQRAHAGLMVRILTRHEDNPSVTPEYLAKLSRLSGARRARLYLHQWVSEEGQVWEEFDPYLHMLDAFSKAPDGHPRKEGHLALDWYFASVDWGFFPDPGVMQVWGVEMWPGQGGEKVIGRLYRVHEIHRLRQRTDWWAERATELFGRYDMRAIVCDPSRPENIELLNDRLSEYCARSVGRLAMRSGRVARKADNAIRVGVDLVGDMLRERRILLVRDALEQRDEELADLSLPVCTEQEIPSYVWPKREDGKPRKDVPDKACKDDGCDAMRYAVSFAWRKDLTPAIDTTARFKKGTFGEILDLGEAA